MSAPPEHPGHGGAPEAREAPEVPDPAPIQVDSEDAASDNDSSYGGGDDSQSTQSLYSSITKYVYENGRRYHSYRQGIYWGPNDEQAQDNLDLFHHIFCLSLGGELFLAPIRPDPHRVLDLGTGTGLWAIDFADAYPSAAVVATDLSPIQPDFVPPNVSFQIDDFTQRPWTFAKSSFDFIHARSIYGSVADYGALYAEVLENLKPGAWFEQKEISVVPLCDDGTLAGTTLESWGPLAIQCGREFGKSFSIAEDMKDLMAQAGFVNVRCHKYHWPIGTWPKDPRMKDIGAYNKLGWEEGMEGWAMFLFTNYLKWRPEEVQVLLAKLRNDVKNKAIHSYQFMYVCYGQRPPEKEESPQQESPRSEGA